MGRGVAFDSHHFQKGLDLGRHAVIHSLNDWRKVRLGVEVFWIMPARAAAFAFLSTDRSAGAAG
jgi:predicted Na+-dependent transporter